MLFRRLAPHVAAVLLLASPAPAQSLDGHPFHAISPATMPWGAHALETGMEYRSSAVPVPILSGGEGDLVRLPDVRYHMGFGRAEMSIGGTLWQSFDPESKGLDNEDEFGDVSFWLSVSALPQRGSRPGLGFAVGAKVPNASDETGLGSDEADTFLAFLLGHDGDMHEWRMNVGLAVLGNPDAGASQEDMLSYALAARHGKRHCFAWEIYGRAFGDSARDLDESTVEAGYMFRGSRVTVEASLLMGLTDNSGDLGASVGAAFRFGDLATTTP